MSSVDDPKVLSLGWVWSTDISPAALSDHPSFRLTAGEMGLGAGYCRCTTPSGVIRSSAGGSGASCTYHSQLHANENWACLAPLTTLGLMPNPGEYSVFGKSFLAALDGKACEATERLGDPGPTLIALIEAAV